MLKIACRSEPPVGAAEWEEDTSRQSVRSPLSSSLPSILLSFSARCRTGRRSVSRTLPGKLTDVNLQQGSTREMVIEMCEDEWFLFSDLMNILR